MIKKDGKMHTQDARGREPVDRNKEERAWESGDD